MIREALQQGATSYTIQYMLKTCNKKFLQGMKMLKTSSPTSKVLEFPEYCSGNDPIF